MIMCVIQSCQPREIMHVMLGSTQSTYTIYKKREHVCDQKSLEKRPCEAMTAACNEPHRRSHVRQNVNEEASQGNYTKKQQISVCVIIGVKNYWF